MSLPGGPLSYANRASSDAPRDDCASVQTAAGAPTNVCQTIRHLPRTTRTCAGFFSGNGFAMLATSGLSTCSGLEHCNEPSRMSIGAGMSSISEIRASRQRAAIPATSEWRDSDKYAFVNSLPAAGCAWEFLRRNPDYRKAWLAASSEPFGSVGESCDAAAWGLVRFESPDRDARVANVFWHPRVSREILPVMASKTEHAEARARIAAIRDAVPRDDTSWPRWRAAHSVCRRGPILPIGSSWPARTRERTSYHRDHVVSSAYRCARTGTQKIRRSDHAPPPSHVSLSTR